MSHVLDSYYAQALGRKMDSIMNEVLTDMENRKGWECPKCDSVFAPHVSECKYCNKPVSIPFTKGTSTVVYCPHGIAKSQYCHNCEMLKEIKKSDLDCTHLFNPQNTCVKCGAGVAPFTTYQGCL
jgi:hypothetical protein